jgi:branched-subunit amino acid ABC-type transport system permease component
VAILAVVVEKIAYKPLRKSSRIAALLTALGVSLFLQNVGMKIFSPDDRPVQTPFENKFYVIGKLKQPVSLAYIKGLDRADFDYYYSMQVLDPATGQSRSEEAQLFGRSQDIDAEAIEEVRFAGVQEVYRYHEVKINTKQIIVFATVIILMICLQALVHYTKIGKAMRAVSIDKETSQLMGINVNNVISFTFLVGGALGGAAGVLYAVYYGKIHPQMGLLPGLKAFIAAVVGGIGIIPGAVIGGLVMGISENMAVGYSGRSEYREAIAFGILILILLIKPSGILGKREKEKV